MVDERRVARPAGSAGLVAGAGRRGRSRRQCGAHRQCPGPALDSGGPNTGSVGPPWESGELPAPMPHFGLTAAQQAARHVQLALRANSFDQHRGWIAVMQQLRQVSQAIGGVQRASGELASARQLDQVGGVLSQTEQRLRRHPTAATDASRSGPSPATRAADLDKGQRGRRLH